jgi:hypothetical protein
LPNNSQKGWLLVCNINPTPFFLSPLIGVPI